MSQPSLSFGPLNEDEFCAHLSQALTALAAKEEDIPLDEMDEEFGMKRLTKPLDKLKFCLHFLGYGALNPAMEKDLKAVRFSFENTIVGDGNGKSLPGFTGLQTHPSGLVFYGLEAGGDWEWPVALIVYHDGTDFRAYIPQEGNAFNQDTRTAYGSEDYAGVPRTNHGGRLSQELQADSVRLMADVEQAFGLEPAVPVVAPVVQTSSLPRAGSAMSKEEFCDRLTEEILVNAAANERNATPASLRNDYASYFTKLANNPEKTLAFCLSRFLGHGPLNAAMEEDLKVIDFDFENVLAGDSDDRIIPGFTGLGARPNGLVFYGLEAGGDWEYPVAFILYHDGEQFRAYVPQEGNSFNPVTRTAYGSEDHVGAEPHDDPGQLEDELEAKPAVMLADIDRTFGASVTPTPGKTAKGKVSTEDCKALLETSTQVLAAGVKGPWKRLKKFNSGGYVVRHFQGTGGFVSVTEDTDGTLALNQVASTAEGLVQPSSPKAPKP